MPVLVVGPNVLDGKTVLVVVQPNGNFKAEFPNWTGGDINGKPIGVEVTSLELLTALVYAILPLHP